MFNSIGKSDVLREKGRHNLRPVAVVAQAVAVEVYGGGGIETFSTEGQEAATSAEFILRRTKFLGEIFASR